MDIVSRQSIGIGDEHRVERGQSRAVAEAIEAGPLERGAAVAVIAEDVALGELPPAVREMGPQAVDLLVDGLRLRLSLRRDTDIDCTSQE
jgi:hypothetical protein